MTSNQNILLLSAGRRVELLQAIKQAAHCMIPDARIFAADMRPALSAACNIADAQFALPHVLSDDYEAALLRLCLENAIGMVIPTIDTELSVLAQLEDKFHGIGTQIVISSPDLIGQCRDKRRTAKLFQSLGIGTPDLFSLDALKFPCFSKPYDGSSSIGAFKIDSIDQITDEMRADPKRMFMRYIPNTYDEYTVDLYYDRGGTLKSLVPRHRLETRAGEISKGVTRKNWLIDYLRPKLDVIEGARGCLTLQLFADPLSQDVQAIEINPRFGGGYPLSWSAGADYPERLIREYHLGEALQYYDGWKDGLLMLRYDAKVLVDAFVD
jgi:carbamoyl-phosphate synthase large subunit